MTHAQKAVLIVGKPGSGKSYFLKNKVLPKLNKVLIFDQYGYEYPDAQRLEDFKRATSLPLGHYRFSGDFWELVKNSGKMPNFSIIVEDATNFLQGAIHDEPLRKMFAARRHYNQQLYFLFHTLSSIPPFLYSMSDFIILFKTKDFKEKVKNRFQDEELFRAFSQLKISKNEHECRFIKI
jgi:Cdc6-like AAA superfamily ATPase